MPGTPWVASRPNRSTVVGSAQWRSSATTKVGVEAAVWASQATRAWRVCWRSASASTSGRDHRSSVLESEQRGEPGAAPRSRGRRRRAGPAARRVAPPAAGPGRSRGAARACARRATARRCRDRASTRPRARRRPRRRTCAASSAASADFPMPATPRTTTDRLPRVVAPPPASSTRRFQMKRSRRL